MNPIIDYFQREVKPSNYNEDKISVYERVVKYSSSVDVLNAVKHVAAFEFGHPFILEAYKQHTLSEEMVNEHLAIYDEILEGFKATNYHNTDHINGVVECMNHLKSVQTILNSDTYLYNKVLETFNAELENAERRIVLEGPQLELTPEQVLETTMALTQAQFNVELVKAFMGPEEEFTTESLLKLERLSNRFENTVNRLAVLEADKNGNGKLDPHEVTVKKSGKEVDDSGGSKLKQTAIKTDEKARDVSNNIRRKSNDFKSSTAGFRKAGGRFTSLLTGTFDKLDRMNKEERLEAVLQGGMRKRLSTLIRTAIIVGGTFAISPALSAIVLLTSATLRRKSDARLKQEVLSEFEAELKLVREKMRDAESAGDRKKKYELMRIENHLEQNIERIKSPVRMNKPKLRKG